MRVASLFFQTDHEYSSPAVREHLDWSRVDRRERRGGDDFLRLADGDSPVGDVDDVIDMWKQRVHVVGDQQDGELTRALDVADELDDHALVAHVELGER